MSINAATFFRLSCHPVQSHCSFCRESNVTVTLLCISCSTHYCHIVPHVFSHHISLNVLFNSLLSHYSVSCSTHYCHIILHVLFNTLLSHPLSCITQYYHIVLSVVYHTILPRCSVCLVQLNTVTLFSLSGITHVFQIVPRIVYQ